MRSVGPDHGTLVSHGLGLVVNYFLTFFIVENFKCTQKRDAQCTYCTALISTWSAFFICIFTHLIIVMIFKSNVRPLKDFDKSRVGWEI